jgi:hypothetical protein
VVEKFRIPKDIDENNITRIYVKYNMLRISVNNGEEIIVEPLYDVPANTSWKYPDDPYFVIQDDDNEDEDELEEEESESEEKSENEEKSESED